LIEIRQADRPFTATDLAEMPDDGLRYEVLWGEMIVSPPPSVRHQWVSDDLAIRIRTFGLQENLGVAFSAPLDVQLGHHNIVQPDILFVLKEHVGMLTESGVIGVPDLLVEVVSPVSRRIDRIRKTATYATFGTPEFWLVDPDTETILAQELRDGRYHPIPLEDGLIRSKVLDGLIIDPQEVFAVPEWMQQIGE
jgi:Uma2 family endonuclease